MKIRRNHVIFPALWKYTKTMQSCRPHEMIKNYVILLASRKLAKTMRFCHFKKMSKNYKILRLYENKQKTMKFCHLHENMPKHDDLPTSRKKSKNHEYLPTIYRVSTKKWPIAFFFNFLSKTAMTTIVTPLERGRSGKS